VSLRIKTEDAGGDTAIMRASGSMTLGETSEFRKASTAAFESGKRKVILDLSGVSSIDSSGMGELVLAFMRSRKEGIEYVLTGLGGKLKDVLTNTRIIGVFRVFPGVDEALEYFKGGQSAGTTRAAET